MTGRAFWISLFAFNAIFAIQGCGGGGDDDDDDDKALGCLLGAFRLEGGERGVFSNLFPFKFCKISTTFSGIQFLFSRSRVDSTLYAGLQH